MRHGKTATSMCWLNSTARPPPTAISACSFIWKTCSAVRSTSSRTRPCARNSAPSSRRMHPREWRFYVSDMIDFAEKVLAYTHEMEQNRFEQSGLNYDTTLRNLELIVIGEGRHPHSRPRSAIRQLHRLAPHRGRAQHPSSTACITTPKPLEMSLWQGTAGHPRPLRPERTAYRPPQKRFSPRARPAARRLPAAGRRQTPRRSRPAAPSRPLPRTAATSPGRA